MNFILKILGGSLGPWLLAGVGGLLAIVLGIAGVQSMRLNHAKADQWDRSACVKDQPCRAVKWEAEVKTLRPALAAAHRDFATCKLNTDAQETTIRTQNTATDKLAADSARRGQMLSDALQTARKTALAANARAEAILALQPSGDDACAKLVDLDKKLNGDVR